MVQPANKRLVTEAALTTALLHEQKLITIDDLPANGVHSAHRAAGGGNGTVYFAPDSALSAARAAIAMGYHIIDCDVQLSQDSVPVVMHDTTFDRTTSGTGLVAQVPASLMPPIDMRYFVGSGWGTEAVPTLEEWFATLGGRVVLTIEPKQVPTGLTVIAPLITARGLGRSVLVNCLYSDFTTLNAIAAAGLYAHVYGATILGDVTGVNAYTNIEIFELPYNASTTIVNAALALPNGPRVLAAPLDKRVNRDAMTAGFNGYVSDAVGYLDKVTDRRDILAEVAQQKVGPGWRKEGSTTARTTFETFGTLTGGVLLSSLAANKSRQWVVGSLCGPKPATYSIDMSTFWSGWVADTNTRPQIRVACPSDEGTNEDADTRGYLLLSRKSGQLSLQAAPVGYGAPTALATIQAPALADSVTATMRLRVDVTATTIAVHRIDSPITLSGSVTAGTVTSLPVTSLTTAVAVGTGLRLANGQLANASVLASIGATSITVTSFTLNQTLPSGGRVYYSTGALANTAWRGDYMWMGGLRSGASLYTLECSAIFWGVPLANLSADVGAGTITSLAVFPLAAAITSGTVLRLPDGTSMTVASTAALNATSISLTSVTVPAMKAGDVIYAQ